MSLLSQLLVFAVSLVGLLALSRWISRQVQVVGLRVTDSSTVAVLLYYLLMFPGILLHEVSHFTAARVLGLRVSKFAMGPRRRRNAIELGSVIISSGGTFRDSLVGLAPFLTGSLVLVLVSTQVFDVATVGQAWTAGGIQGFRDAMRGVWQVPDVWLWAYVVFVVSNAMTPSAADRQPWLLAAIYVGAALGILWLLGGLPVLDPGARERVAGLLHVLTLGFIFSIAVNLAVAMLLWLLEALVLARRRS